MADRPQTRSGPRPEAGEPDESMPRNPCAESLSRRIVDRSTRLRGDGRDGDGLGVARQLTFTGQSGGRAARSARQGAQNALEAIEQAME